MDQADSQGKMKKWKVTGDLPMNFRVAFMHSL
jgi:hypothetical protein